MTTQLKMILNVSMQSVVEINAMFKQLYMKNKDYMTEC